MITNYISAFAGGAATFAALFVYDLVIDDPSVAREARSGYVAFAEKTKLEAQLAEYKRQVDAGNESILAFAKTLSELRAKEESEDKLSEEKVRAYEKKLSESDRKCGLTDDDIDFLQQ